MASKFKINRPYPQINTMYDPTTRSWSQVTYTYTYEADKPGNKQQTSNRIITSNDTYETVEREGSN